MWPLVCSFGLSDATAMVSGSNQLLSYTSTRNESVPLPLSSDTNKSTLSNPFSQYWARLITLIYRLSVSEPFIGIGFSTTFLQDQLVPILVGDAMQNVTTLPVNSTSQRIAAFENTLSQVTRLAYALILDAVQSPANGDSDTFVWQPERMGVPASKNVIVARLRVTGFQLFVALASVGVLGIMIFLVIRGSDADELVADGVLDITLLMNKSALPKNMFIELDDPKYEKRRRWMANDLTVE